MICSSTKNLLHLTLQTTRCYLLSTSVVSASSVKINELLSENSPSASDVNAGDELQTTAKFSKIDLVKHEYEIWKHADSRMPLELLSRHIDELISLPTAHERLIYLTNLGDGERLRDEKASVKKLRRQAFNMMSEDDRSRDSSFYGMGGNFLFQRICKRLYMKWAVAHYAAQAPTTKFTVAFDFSLIEQCIHRDQQATLKTIEKALRRNVSHRQPSQILFTSFDRQSYWCNKWEGSTIFPADSESLSTATTHQEHVTDLFPLDRIIYLSPDSVSVLNNVDEDKIYVIGALEDGTRTAHNATFAEAKKRAIPCYRLPIEKYINWRSGSKSLSLCTVHQILLDYMLTYDWRTSLLNHLEEWQTSDRSTNPMNVWKSPEDRVRKSERDNFRKRRNDFLLKLARVENA